jgi:hypothetical protein
MGREIRRVPLDFDWPLNKPWKGFLNPYGGPCPAEERGECFDGVTAGRRYVTAIAHLLGVAGSDAMGKRRNGIWPHPYLHELPMSPRFPRYSANEVGPTPDLVDLIKGLVGRQPMHDACDRFAIEHKIIAAAGLDPERWGVCSICEGHADDPAQRNAAEAWEPSPPPEGEAYQLWETVSEGSPISPPKATPEALARWLADHGASSFGEQTESYETWLRFIMGPGWAPSAISHNGVFHPGVSAIAEMSLPNRAFEAGEGPAPKPHR